MTVEELVYFRNQAITVFFCSTPVLVLRVQARLWPLLVPAWRNSAVLHSLSVMAVEPATTTPTPTAFGLPPLKTTRCLRKTEALTLACCIFNSAPLENLVFADLHWSNFSPCCSDVHVYSRKQSTLLLHPTTPFRDTECGQSSKRLETFNPSAIITFPPHLHFALDNKSGRLMFFSLPSFPGNPSRQR